jgi:hypothetical protein
LSFWEFDQLSDHVDVRGSFFVTIAIDDTIRAVERGRWSMVRLRLPMRLLSRGRLPVAQGSFVRNSQDLRNLDGFYHNPMIDNIA